MIGSRSKRRFHGDEGGATAIIFALTFVPIAGLMAGAVDFSRATEKQGRDAAGGRCGRARRRAIYAGQCTGQGRGCGQARRSRGRGQGLRRKRLRRQLHAGNDAQRFRTHLHLQRQPRLGFRRDRPAGDVSQHHRHPKAWICRCCRRPKRRGGGMSRSRWCWTIHDRCSKTTNTFGWPEPRTKFIAKVEESSADGAKIGLVPFSTLVAAELTGEHLRGEIPSITARP